MKIAFLIAAHAYPELLARLVKRLENPVASIFIHIDKRSAIRPFLEVLRERRIRDVHFVPRVPSRWGTFGQVRASLSLLRAALATEKEATMFILLSGQDYPLLVPELMAEYFERNGDASFMSWALLPWSSWPDEGGFERLKHFHFLLGRDRVEFPSPNFPTKRGLRLFYSLCCWFLPAARTLPENIAFYGGMNWWSITRQAAEYIFRYLRENPDYVKIFRYSKSSDEIFFQTILLNWCDAKLINNNLRCVFWDGRRGEYPAVLTHEDFVEVKNSGMLFARKVHPYHSSKLLDRIDSELLTVG
jgi:Core-2/I-Branching enzyme